MKLLLHFFRLIRIVNLCIIVIGVSLFYYLIIVPTHKNKLFTTLLPFTDFEFFLFVISVVFIAAAGSIINDYFDFERDREYNPERPLPQGALSLDTAIYLQAFFAFAGIGLGFYLGNATNNLKIGYMFIIYSLLFYLHSAYLRKILLVGNIVASALYGFVFVLLLLFEISFLNLISFDAAGDVLSILWLQVKFYGGFVFLIALAGEIVKDIRFSEGDEAHNVNTLAVQFGSPTAKALAAFVLMLLLGGVGFFMQGFLAANATREFFYLLLMVVIPVLASIALLFFAKEQKHYHRLSLLLKVIMFSGIFSIPAFYLFNH